MKILKYIFLFTAVVMFNGPVAAQEEPIGEVGISAVPVVDKIYMIERLTGNIGISIGDEGVLVVDDQSIPLTEIELDAIKKLSDASIRYINGKDQILTSFNGQEIRTTRFAGAGNENDPVMYFVSSNVAFLGKHFSAGMFPLIDVDAGGDVEKFTDNIAVILNAIPDDVKIVPGRGLMATKDDLLNFQRMLIETTVIVSTQMEEGKNRETIQREGLGEQWTGWGNGPVSINQWIGIIYDSLKRKQHP